MRILFINDFLRQHYDSVDRRVIGNRKGSYDEFWLVEALELALVLWKLARAGKILQQLTEMQCQGPHLLLFHLHGDQGRALSNLKVKDTLSGWANRSRSYTLGMVEFVRLAHVLAFALALGGSSVLDESKAMPRLASSPVELTERTAGVPDP